MSVGERITVGEAMRRAEAMYAGGKGGWSIQGIQHYLARQGVERSWQTVKRWADPKFAERRRVETRQRERTRWGQRTDGKLGRRDHSPEFRVARIRALHSEAGLSVSALVRLMRFDYDPLLTRHEVERAVLFGVPPKRWLAAEKSSPIPREEHRAA